MTAAPEVVDPLDPASEAAHRLRWISLMAVLVLLAVGAGTGRVAFLAVSGPDAFRASAACLVSRGVDLGSVTRGLEGGGPSPAFITCTRDYARELAAAQLGGAAAIPFVAWLLMLLDGSWARRWLRRRGGIGYASPALDALGARFEYWCDRAALSGSRRPDLIVGGAGRSSAQARTIAVPFGRSMVVIPGAYAYADRSQLDFAVLHELAHVRARDSTSAATLWWAGQLIVPVGLVAFALPGAGGDPVAGVRWYLVGLGLVLAASLLVLRAALLRRRELAADAYALAVLADPGVLVAAARTVAPPARSRTSRLRSRARSLIALHPAPGQRVRAAGRVPGAWETGFAPAAVVALLAMFLHHTLLLLLIGTGSPVLIGDGRRPFELAFAGASVLWSAVLVPIWVRAGTNTSPCRTGSRPVDRPDRGYRAAILGSTTGLAAGYLLRSPAELEPRSLFTGHQVAVAGWFLLVSLGVSLIATGFAHAASRAAPGTPRRTATAVAVAASAGVGAAAFSMTYLCLTLAIQFGAPTVRGAVTTAGQTRWTAWMMAVPLVAALVLALTGRSTADPSDRPSTRALARVVLATSLTGAALAVVSTQVRIADTTTTGAVVHELLLQRWWVCAAVGAVALVAVLITVNGATLAHALLAGTAVTVLVALAQFGRDTLTGPSGRNLHNLINFVRVPVWLLGVLLVLVVPTVLLARQLAGPARRRAQRSQATRAQHPPHTWAAPAAGAGGAIVVTLIVMTGLASAGTGRPTDPAAQQAALRRTEPPQPWSVRPEPTLAPAPSEKSLRDASLTPAEAKAVMSRVAGSVPPGWRADPDSDPDFAPATGIKPRSCADLFAQDQATDKQRPRSSSVTRTFSLPNERLPPFGASMTLTLTSYRTPAIAAAAAQDALGQRRGCPAWTTPLEGGATLAYSCGICQPL